MLGSCFCCGLMDFFKKFFQEHYQSLVTVTLKGLWYTVSQNCISQQWLVSQNSHSLNTLADVLSARNLTLNRGC